MSYRAELADEALRQMHGLPEAAFDAFTDALAAVCADPRDRLRSTPAPGDERSRVAELGDRGFFTFEVDEARHVVRVYELVWTG